MATQSGRILVGALDRIVSSSANYWPAMLSDLAAVLAFLALGLNRLSGPWVVAGQTKRTLAAIKGKTKKKKK